MKQKTVKGCRNEKLKIDKEANKGELRIQMINCFDGTENRVETWMYISPKNLYKFCTAGLQMCRELEGKQ